MSVQRVEMLLNSALVYQREDFDPKARDWKRQRELMDAHAMELRGMPADPDIFQYQRLQREGRLVIITARDGQGILQGYSSHFWHRDLHFNIRVAQDDGIYVVPELRKQGVGTFLRKMAIHELKKAGVQVVLGRLKVAHPHDESMTELGFVPWETVYIREI